VGDIAPAIAIGAGIIIVYIAGTYAVQQNGKTIGTYTDLKTAQKNTQYLLDGIGSGLKWVWNGGAWVVEQGGRIFAKKQSKKSGKESANDYPSSVNVNASRTNGSRVFVDNQSTFVVGEGSNLHVGTVENTGAIIGKEGNSTFKIDIYVGKNIQNYDTMTTTGGSIGASLGGKPKISI